MKWWQKILAVITVIIGAGLCMAYLAMFISPATFWPAAFFGLAYLAFLIAFVLLMIAWFFIRKKIFFVQCIVLILGWKAHAAHFGIHLFGHAPNEDDITILQYNVQAFDAYNKEGKFKHRTDIIQNIQDAHADIICLEEFNTYQNHPTEPSSLDMVKEACGLPYFYYYKAYENKKATRSVGIILFSRYPIKSTGNIAYNALSKLNSTIYADLDIEGNTIRVFVSHLQSTQLSHYDLEFIEASDNNETNFSAERFTNKLKTSYSLRAHQVDSITRVIAESPYPVISCGDFNDTPVSYSYRSMSKNLQDAFLHSGFGIGATYSPFPFIRIDYMLFDEDAFDITGFKRMQDKNSDHYACISSFRLSDQ